MFERCFGAVGTRKRFVWFVWALTSVRAHPEKPLQSAPPALRRAARSRARPQLAADGQQLGAGAAERGVAALRQGWAQLRNHAAAH
jgi:hypothetical protein